MCPQQRAAPARCPRKAVSCGPPALGLFPEMWMWGTTHCAAEPVELQQFCSTCAAPHPISNIGKCCACFKATYLPNHAV